MAREIVKTVKTEESEEEVTPVCQERLQKLVLLRRTDFQRLVARWPELLSRIQFFAAHKDNHGEMAAGAKRLKLAAQREHDASGRLEELFQRGGHELLHPAAPSC